MPEPPSSTAAAGATIGLMNIPSASSKAPEKGRTRRPSSGPPRISRSPAAEKGRAAGWAKPREAHCPGNPPPDQGPHPSRERGVPANRNQNGPAPKDREGNRCLVLFVVDDRNQTNPPLLTTGCHVQSSPDGRSTAASDAWQACRA